MVVLEEMEIPEQDSLHLTRNLLRNAIYKISYIRGLFHEKYFSDKFVPPSEMKIKKLMPMDAESTRLVDCIEKGVLDALQKKYLKTFLFCICGEEDHAIEKYQFSFSYPKNSGVKIEMLISCRGVKKGGTTFTTNASVVTPDEMRSSACKMIRTLVSLMRTLDPIPEERTIIMKLLYYDDVTADDYEPPFLKCCDDTDAVNIWNKNPLKMEVGSANKKYLVLALKDKNALDLCVDNNDFSDTENWSKEIDKGVERMEYHAVSILKTKYGDNWDHVYSDGKKPLKYIAELFPNETQAFCDADGSLYHSEDYSFDEKENYPGIPPIYNSVTICLDGPPDVVAYRVKMAAGHMRLYNAFYGDVLDISSFLPYPKLIYTTAATGTFYVNFTCSEHLPEKDDVIRHWVRLVVDGRLGWCYGLVNRHGHFEFNHPLQLRYINHRSCKMLEFAADYSVEGIAPDGHGRIEMGHLPLRIACISLSEFNGQEPASEEVRRSCGILVNGSCEIYKFHSSLFWLSVAINEGKILCIDDCHPELSRTVKNWFSIGRSKMEVYLRRLANPEPLEPNLPNIPGLLTEEDAFDTLSIVPWNTVPRFDTMRTGRLKGNERTWCWSLMEAHGDGLLGRPHVWSPAFLGPAPYIPEMERVRPRDRIIDGADVGRLLANKMKRGEGTAARDVKTYEVRSSSSIIPLATKALNALRKTFRR